MRERVPQTLATSIASTPITTAPNPYCQQQAPVLHINRVITTTLVDMLPGDSSWSVFFTPGPG